MKKCVVISGHYPPDMGGVGDYTEIFSRELSKHGYEVHVITSAGHKEESNYGVNVIPIIHKSGRLIDYIDKLNPEFVNLQYAPYMYSKYGWNSYVARILNGIKGKTGHVVTTFHETYVEPMIHRPKVLILSLIQYISYRRLVSESDLCLVSVQYYKDIAPARYRDKFRVLPVGSNIVSDTPLKMRNVSNERFTIAVFGAYFHPYRRFDTIMKSLDKLPDNLQSRVKLLVLGQIGMDKKFLELLDSFNLKIDVEITGRLSREQVLRKLSGSDLFIMFEQAKGGRGGVGLRNGSLLAALSANLPCLINSGVHTDDDLKKICYTVDDLDSGLIAERIASIIRDRSEQDRKRIAVNTYYTQHLHWDKIVETFLSYIDKRSIIV